MKKRIVVVCPGRGSYTKETLGYLNKYQSKFSHFIAELDQEKSKLNELTISELDKAESFKPALHTKGEHASTLIYACSYCDFLNIDSDKYEVVAVTGNSMGWYIAMAVAGALGTKQAFNVINIMGSMMKSGIIGGQIIYPITDVDWQIDQQKKKQVQSIIFETNLISGCQAYISIHLGGYLVIGGNQKALDHLLKALPKQENYPFQLLNHAAFHTPLLQETSVQAFAELTEELFSKPRIPMVDGRGHLWMPYSTNVSDLYQYTLGHQVTEVYDFTKAISFCLKEFCPDHLVLLGPGNTLGGSIGQILVENNWRNIKSKTDFTEMQKETPFLISLGK